MIDKQKTEFLRNKIQQVRGTNQPEQKEEPKNSEPNKDYTNLLLYAARFFTFYGALWIILNQVGVIPFSLLQTLIIFLATTYLLKTGK
jgi:hypothetical protein